MNRLPILLIIVPLIIGCVCAMDKAGEKEAGTFSLLPGAPVENPTTPQEERSASPLMVLEGERVEAVRPVETLSLSFFPTCPTPAHLHAELANLRLAVQNRHKVDIFSPEEVIVHIGEQLVEIFDTLQRKGIAAPLVQEAWKQLAPPLSSSFNLVGIEGYLDRLLEALAAFIDQERAVEDFSAIEADPVAGEVFSISEMRERVHDLQSQSSFSVVQVAQIAEYLKRIRDWLQQQKMVTQDIPIEIFDEQIQSLDVLREPLTAEKVVALHSAMDVILRVTHHLMADRIMLLSQQEVAPYLPSTEMIEAQAQINAPLSSAIGESAAPFLRRREAQSAAVAILIVLMALYLHHATDLVFGLPH